MTINTEVGKITASKEVLNYLSLVISEASKYYESKGSFALEKKARGVASEIFDALDDTGYYDNIK